jgi:hypothetical protein
MGIVFDIVIALIILINIYICYQKGLVKLAVGLIAVVVSIILAILLYKPISDIIIKNTEIDDNIEKSIIENFTVNEESSEQVEDNGLMIYMEKYVDNAVNKTKNQIVIEAAGTIANKLINIGVMIGIFIVVRVALILLTFIADVITELPLIKQFNVAGGIVYGVIKSLLIIYVALAIVFFIVYTTGNTTISEAIANSYITKFFYNNNILLTIIF